MGFVVLNQSKKYSSLVARMGVALLALALTSFSALAQQAQREVLPFPHGEELVYRAEFNKGLLRGVDVAEFRFRAETQHLARSTAADNPFIVRLVGDVATKGFFTRLVGFRYRQHVESVVDPNPFTALRTSKLEEQGKRARASEAAFDHQARRVTWTERDPNKTQPPRISAIDFSEPIQDVLTVIYFLRTHKLEVGKSFDVPLSDNGRVYRFSVAVVERKQLRTVLGPVSAVRVEPALFGENGLVRSRGTLSIWITEDSRRLPVKAQVKVDIGTFDIKLKRVTYREASRAR